MSRAEQVRLESDSLGTVEVPAHAYWGVHTLRARENFPISGTPISRHPALIRALAVVKQAAARANRGLGSWLEGDELAYAELLEERVERAVDAATATLRGFAQPPGRKVMLLLSGVDITHTRRRRWYERVA